MLNVRADGTLSLLEPSTYDVIHLASDEYGNELMELVARNHFRSFVTCEFVEVIEHGGWYLGFRRDMSIWSTANDAALLEKGKPFPHQYSGRTIRRS